MMMNIDTLEGLIPANVSDRVRPIVAAGFASAQAGLVIILYLYNGAGMFHAMPIKTATHRHASDTSDAEHLRVMADLFGLLADPSRLKMLFELRQCEAVCVSDLAVAAGLSESAVSHSLRLLRAHGIVEATREGRWIYYALVDTHVTMLLDATAAHLNQDHSLTRPPGSVGNVGVRSTHNTGSGSCVSGS